jgi:hypothetical protein
LTTHSSISRAGECTNKPASRSLWRHATRAAGVVRSNPVGVHRRWCIVYSRRAHVHVANDAQRFLARVIHAAMKTKVNMNKFSPSQNTKKNNNTLITWDNTLTATFPHAARPPASTLP